MDDIYIQTEIHQIQLAKDYTDKVILDIGGGGEGFIGQLYGNRVIAIDKRLDELEETNNEAINLVMDGSELAFVDNAFDVVTVFYSLMYMKKSTREKVLSEAYRVLKPGGILEIWDSEVPRIGDGKDFFVANLRVECQGVVSSVSYGIGLDEEDLQINDINALLVKLGFIAVSQSYDKPMFNLKLMKKSN